MRPDETLQWFERLYPPGSGLINIAHLPAKGTFKAGTTHLTPAAAAAAVTKLDATGAKGVYHRVTTLAQALPRGTRGGAEHSHALPGLWADVDFGTDGHKHDPDKHDGRPLPPDAEAAWQLVTKSGLPEPSVWIHTGGGLYPYWLLTEPLHLNEGTRDQVQDVSNAWQQALRRSAHRLGWEYGAGVGDLSRVLRAPGTTNRKTGQDRDCRIVEDTGTAYTLDELVAALTALPAPESSTPRPAPAQPRPRPATDPLRTGTSAFDTLDEHVTFDDLLLGADWTRCTATHGPAIEACWNRPGYTNPCSAHTLTAQPNVLVVHSENAGLPTGGGQKLTRGRLFAHLHHGGHERTAALDLYAAMRNAPSTPAAAALPLPRSPMPPRPADLGTLGERDTELHQTGQSSADLTSGPPVDPLVDQPPPETSGDQDNPFELEVSDAAHRIRVRQAAQELVRSEQAGTIEVPDFTRLDEFLARPLPPTTHRVASLWPAGGNVLLAAQWKAGKTTLRDNLSRSLVDSTPFLGLFPVDTENCGSVALIDVELDEHTLQRWLDDQAFERPERLHVLSLRGRASTFNILDDTIRARWAKQLRALGTSQLIIDCLRPILDALGLDEHKEAGRFLEALDALGHEAGISEKFLVHHMGHGSERSRGDSRLLDWPDALWKLTRLKTDDDPTLDDPAGPRFFSAFGRDVNHPESELTYDDESRRLTLGADASNRKAAGSARKAAAARPAVLEVIRANPGVGIREIRTKCDGHGNPAIDTAVKQLIDEGVVHVIRQGQKHCHYDTTTPNVPTVPNRAQTVPGHGGVNRARVPLGTGTPPEHTNTPPNHPGTGTVNDHFEPPTGPNRCDICGSHTPTQGHTPHCPERNAS